MSKKEICTSDLLENRRLVVMIRDLAYPLHLENTMKTQAQYLRLVKNCLKNLKAGVRELGGILYDAQQNSQDWPALKALLHRECRVTPHFIDSAIKVYLNELPDDFLFCEQPVEEKERQPWGSRTTEYEAETVELTGNFLIFHKKRTSIKAPLDFIINNLSDRQLRRLAAKIEKATLVQ